MYKPGEHEELRLSARRFEEALSAKQRKHLGQFFTGIPLGKLLAHLAITSDMRTVLDPMVGHGDLLDATNEAALESGIALQRIDGIEIDNATTIFCRDRLKQITRQARTLRHCIVSGNAFDSAALAQLPEQNYDLTITNPPYVRYQSQNNSIRKGETVRARLAETIEQRLKGAEKIVWLTLTQGYSGLADLSIPAWILAALTVRPGGRLALVIPATWRSRTYGDVIRYLLLRCFQLEFIVEDTQPGWFSDALIRTHLIVARRLQADELAEPLANRATWPSAHWIQIAPEAADSHSLVGSAFTEKFPEAAFSNWIHSGSIDSHVGIQTRAFSLYEEWASLTELAARRPWYQKLESNEATLPLFSVAKSSAASVPDVVRDILGRGPELSALSTLEELGIRAGQGLRTGCNRFFYVDVCDSERNDLVRVKASSAFHDKEFSVPTTALRPVLRRQSEIPFVERKTLPPGRVLDLRKWILPEDAETIAAAIATYDKLAEPIPEIMPSELAAFVRHAARTTIDEEAGKRVPELSAVRTNIRAHRSGATVPRFWYMLPDFAQRHQPGAFVARINHGAPWVECNLDSSILIDANFSTFWPTGENWTRFSVKALLNSAWCQLMMEALGTPMGGGALKLEAVHLRQMPIPRFSAIARAELDQAGRNLSLNSADTMERINAIVLDAVWNGQAHDLTNVAIEMTDRATKLRQSRLRAAA